MSLHELMKLVTFQYLSIVHYPSALWIGSLDSKSWKRINSAHYSAFRAAIGFTRYSSSRSEIDKLTKRATPVEWAQYSVALTIIKLFNQSDTNIMQALQEAVYVNDRMPGKGRFVDRLRLKVGKQSLPNRIRLFFFKTSFDWAGFHLSDDT